ncbi:MAG: type II toxin-antitoxin system HicA family toxin [Deltaproteobacteria bacterium]|nr:type II toxin-antitoxin system HicA family toxin [Deltaproteobacteria bacterium]
MSKKPGKLWAQIQNNAQNVRFGDFLRLVEWFGFVAKGGRGSHRTFFHPGVREILDLQELGGEAKPYQIRQLLKLVRQYGLKGGAS